MYLRKFQNFNFLTRFAHFVLSKEYSIILYGKLRFSWVEGGFVNNFY